MNGLRGWLLWELGHLFCVPDMDHVKQKNYSLETTPSRFSLNRKQRSLLLYVISVQDMKFWVEFWKPLIPGQIVNSFGQGKCTFDCQSGNSKTLPLAAHVSTRSCMLRMRNWSTSTWLVCEHFIQIHSCMGICFSCIYTNNCEHFHKWFGTLYRDNSVLMRILDIQ